MLNQKTPYPQLGFTALLVVLWVRGDRLGIEIYVRPDSRCRRRVSSAIRWMSFPSLTPSSRRIARISLVGVIILSLQ